MQITKSPLSPGKIDTTIEHPYTLRELRKYLPNSPTYNTLLSYVRVGIPSANGRKTVRLEAILIGGRIHSTVEAYHRLIEEANR